MKLLLVIVPALLLVFLTPLSAEAKTYENDQFTFDYPNGCKLEKKENRFSSAKADLECKGDAGFHVEFSDNPILSLQDDSSMLDAMETTFGNLYDNTNVIQRSDDPDAKQYVVNNATVRYILGSYDQVFYTLFGGERTKPYALMTAYVKLNADESVLIQYRNNEDSFDKQLPLAEKILQSVKGVGNGTGTGTGTETETETETNKSFTSPGDDFPKTSALCDTVTTQSAKDLCETLLS
jgi:hypothetical protein